MVGKKTGFKRTGYLWHEELDRNWEEKRWKKMRCSHVEERSGPGSATALNWVG
jgi:hypothetical protein